MVLSTYCRSMVLAAGLVAGFAMAALPAAPAAAQEWIVAGQDDCASLKASPPKQGLSNEDIKIGVEYSLKCDLGQGKLAVTYHNVDTGDNYVKTLDVPLSKGNHKIEAVWSKDDALTNGMYVVKAILSDSKGKELATFATDPNSVKSLQVVGGATRVMNPDDIINQTKQFQVWIDELTALEQKARAAGADTTRQHILIVVIQQAQFWSKEQINFKWFDVLDNNIQYLKAQVALVTDELNKLIANPDALPKAPRIHHAKERYTIRDGYWHEGNDAVFLNGPAFFDFTLPYIPIARELGFNIIQISTGPWSIFPDEASYTMDPASKDFKGRKELDKIKKVLDQCQELGIKVDLGLTAHFMPDWVYKKWPDSKNNNPNFMFPYDMDEPHVLEVIQKFYDVVMPEIAHHPALNSIWVTNEPGYMNPSALNLAKFRPWLQKKYATVDALNKAWGAQLKGLDDIQPPTGRAYIPAGVTTSAATGDWWRYTSERVTDHFNWMRDMVHKYDPELAVSVKLFNATFNPQFKPPMRVNEEPVFDSMAYYGYDGGSYPFSKPYKDFIRSLGGSKPMANLEYKFGGQRTKMDFWQEAMQGASQINFWAWHPKRAFSPTPADSRSLHWAALDTLDIQRLFPQVQAFNKLPRAPMVLLYPDPVFTRYWEFFTYNDVVNRQLSMMGYNVDYASEKRVAEGRLDDYRVLIMPSADFISDQTYAKVKAFVEKGGTAIALGSLPVHDEMEHDRDASFFTKPDKKEVLTVDGMTVEKYTAGKGVVYHLADVPRSDDGKGHFAKEATQVIKDFLEQSLGEVLPVQPVVIRDIENRTIAYVNADGQPVYLTYVVNEWFDGAYTIKPKFNFKVGTARDLISGQGVDPNNIVIPPTDVMLLEFSIAP